MRRLRALAACSALLVAGLPAFCIPAAQADDPRPAVAIVVHPGVTVEDLTMDQLRRIFLAEQQYWSASESKIILLVRAPTAYERDLVLDRIYRMDEDRFRQYWIAKMFRAEVPSGPKIVFSTNMARELVTTIPGSITFIPAADVGDAVKVLRIDGKLPGDADYPLK